MKSLADIGEDALVADLVGMLEQDASVIVGPGDDCAVIDAGEQDVYQLMKTDCLVEGIHYESGEDPVRIGWKAVARVISDFAAMGGRAEYLLVTIAMPSAARVGDIENLYKGMQRCASMFGACICGGETSSVPDGSAAVISIAGTGKVSKARLATRSGGKHGDAIMVTGTLGGSIAGKHLDFTPRAEEAKWLCGSFDIHAMMDVSDGLARDLPRLAYASQCGYEIDATYVPVTSGCDLSQALNDGEDYELLFTLTSSDVDALLEAWWGVFPETKLTKIGRLCDEGEGDDFKDGGWQHFHS